MEYGVDIFSYIIEEIVCIKLLFIPLKLTFASKLVCSILFNNKSDIIKILLSELLMMDNLWTHLTEMI